MEKLYMSKTPHNSTRIYIAGERSKETRFVKLLENLSIWGNYDHTITINDIEYNGYEISNHIIDHVVGILEYLSESSIEEL